MESMHSCDDAVEKDEAEDCTNEDHETDTNSSRILFVEEEEVLHLIALLSPTSHTEHFTTRVLPVVTKSSNFSIPLRRLRTIFDKYLECPTLLDQSLECLIGRSTAPIVDICHQWERGGLQNHDNGVSEDVRLFIDSIRYLASAIYCICKVRGRKYVQRFLPHHVSDVTPVWMALQTMLELNHQEERTASLPTDTNIPVTSKEHLDIPDDVAPLWETTYVLWVWMSTLSLVPFDCNKFTATVSTSVTDVVTREVPFIVKLIETCQRHLGDTGIIRHGVSICLASWLSRPDTTRDRQHFTIFVEKSIHALQTFIQHDRNNNSSDLFYVLGILQTLTTILKVSSIPRDVLLKQVLPFWEPSLQLSRLFTNDVLLQKLLVKWWTRISCTLLPPRLVSWRYQRGERFLLQSQLRDATSSTTVITPESGNLVQLEEGVVHMEDALIVPDEVEFAMGQIIDALSNSSTIVRWSAAKGVGRITERLPSLCADDVLDAILFLFHDTNNDRCWHGACLALAELARRGLLLPQRLREVVPFLVQAVQFDRRRGSVNVGAHVRDAACYTYWAFARAYEPEILRPFMSFMTQSIIMISLFDREVNCRRAASSAFQEAVGRLGATTFPHGIEILTAADYFSLGNRTNAYLSIAIQVATYDELRQPIIQHLYISKLYHWDINIRTLSCKALNKLTSFDPKFMCDVVIPVLLEKCLDEKDLFTRHGAVLGVAEIVLALSTSGNLDSLPSNIEELLTELVPTIERKRLYRGRGGEIMRSAVCRLIECISLAEIPLTVKGQVRLLDSIESNIPHPTEKIQEDACQALEALMTTYFPVTAAGPSQRLQQRVVDKFIETIQNTENPAVARGYALALGRLPVKLICPTMEVLLSILNCLMMTSHHDALVGKEYDAETRRNSLRSLVRISRLLLITPVHTANNGNNTTLRPVVQMSKDIFERLCVTFLTAMDDYRTDRRGDVGSWCRLVGMEGVTELLIAVARNREMKSLWIVDNALVSTNVGAMLKQLSEKLDFVRRRAGVCLQQLLLAPYLVDVIVSHPELVRALNLSRQSDEVSNENRWIDPSLTFMMVMDVATITKYHVYFEYVISGIVSSIGGLTADVYKYSSSSLLHFMKQSSPDRKEQLLMYLIKMFQQRSNRLVQSILKTIDLLLTHGCCQDVMKCQLHFKHDDFIEHCIQCLQREVKLSTNVSRLFLVADVSVSILTSFVNWDEGHGPTITGKKQLLLAFLCSMLLHPFPRVRTYVAEQMYMYVLENDNVENHTSNDNDSSTTGSNNNSGTNEMIQKLLFHTLWSDEVVSLNTNNVELQPLHHVPIQIATAFGVSIEFQSIIDNNK